MSRTTKTLGIALLLAVAGCTKSEAPVAEARQAPEKQPETTPVPEGAREALGEALVGYEQGRALLAGDSLEGMGEVMAAVSAALTRAEGAWPDRPAAVGERLKSASEHALHLGQAQELEPAREAFGKLSEPFVALAAAVPELREGWQLFSCPMATGFDKWLQRPGDIANPYMGQRMLACGAAAEWTVDEQHPGEHVHDPDEIAYYTCPMHPSVKQSGPGQCPLCGMDLTPVTKGDAASGTVFVDNARRKQIGVKTGKVERGERARTLRALGRVVYDERKVHDVTLRLGGWVEKLYVNETGQEVKRGQVLFTLYSPELYAAQVEFLQAVKTAKGGSTLAKAARKRLKLWSLSDAQLDRIAAGGEPLEAVPIASPATGFVVEKDVVEGSRVGEGERAFRVAELSEVWVEVDLYEGDLRLVEKGTAAVVTLPYLPGERYEGEVSFVAPTLHDGTRVARARVVLDNADLKLKPRMYANVSLEVPLGERLWVPESAVLYTGARRLVFKDLGEGRLAPQVIEVGVKSDGFYEVLSGLEEGEPIVTSGNFLIAAESRISAGAFDGVEP